MELLSKALSVKHLSGLPVNGSTISEIFIFYQKLKIIETIETKEGNGDI